MTIYTYRALDAKLEELTEHMRDLAIYLQRVARNTGQEQTARLVGEVIDAVTPDEDKTPTDAFG